MKRCIILLAAMCTVTWHTDAQALSCAEYLKQVKQNNAQIDSLRKAMDASRLASAESALLFAPYVTAGALYGDDFSQSMQPTVYGKERLVQTFGAGLEEQTFFGLRWRLFHQTMYSALTGTSPLYNPLPTNYACTNGLELALDIWRNIIGSEVRAASDALYSKSQSALYMRKYQERQLLAQAQIIYWRYAFAEESVRIQEQMLQRAQGICDWVSNRVTVKMMDLSDLLQAQAQVHFRQSELSAARDESQTIRRLFFQMRGATDSGTNETLPLPTADDLSASNYAPVPPSRLDIRAMEHSTKSAASDAVRKQHALMPEVQLRGSVYASGLSKDFDTAFSNALLTNHITFGVGVTFRVPLDLFTRLDSMSSYQLEADSAARLLAYNREIAANDWKDLVRRLDMSRQRWVIARKLEETQVQKATREQDRLRKGNSVVYQVLQYEQDLGQSRLARIRCESMIMELQAHLSTFGE